MKINITPGKLNQGELLIDDRNPIPPFPGIDINDLFDLEIFELSKNNVKPFQLVTLKWSIVAKKQNINIADYRFRLKVISPKEIIDSDLEPSGESTHHPISGLLYQITGERRGIGNGKTLGKFIQLIVDKSNCFTELLPKNIFLGLVRVEYDKLINEIKELKRGQKIISTDPVVYGDKEVTLDFDAIPNKMHLFFPFMLDIPFFFNADFDVKIQLKIRVTHEDLETSLSVDANISSDVSFSVGEHILSGGNAFSVQKTADKLMPIILECKRPNIEKGVLRSLLSYIDNLTNLTKNRLLKIHLNTENQISFVFCPIENELLEPLVLDERVLANPN